MLDFAILGARRAEVEGRWNIGIQNGTIVSLEPEGRTVDAHKKLYAEGQTVLPGLVDAHVHTRDPGYPHKEDAHSAAMAAAAGGITTILAMPNCNPPLTTAAAVQYAKEHMTAQGFTDLYLVGGLCSSAPKWSIPAVQAGAMALDIYDDLFAYGTQTWIYAFHAAKEAGVPLCFYLMDSAMERLRRTQSTAAGWPEEEQISGATDGQTESISIARIVPLAAYFQVPVVLRMVTTASALETVRQMRRLFPEAAVYVEVCIPYLFLTHDALLAQGARAHIHPPLRTQADVDALWAGIADGTVDYLATDHAPHAAAEKDRPRLSECASGIVGLETMLPLLLDACVKGRLSLADIQRLCCHAPAQIYGLSQKGSLAAGADADLVLVDLTQSWRVSSADSRTRGAPGPFEGWQLQGRPSVTIHRGNVVMKDGRILQTDKE